MTPFAIRILWCLAWLFLVQNVASGGSAGEEIKAVGRFKGQFANHPGEYSVEITYINTSASAHRLFLLDNITPVIIDDSGNVKVGEDFRDATRRAKETDCPLLKPGKSTTLNFGLAIGPDAVGKHLTIGDRFGGLFQFDPLAAGAGFWLCVTYVNPHESGLYEDFVRRFPGSDREQVRVPPSTWVYVKW